MPLTVRLLCLATPLVLAATGLYSKCFGGLGLENLAIFVAIVALWAMSRTVPLSTLSFSTLCVRAPTNTVPFMLQQRPPVNGRCLG